MENIVKSSEHLSTLTVNYTIWGEDLIMHITVKSLCFMLETNMILHINYSSIKKNIKIKNKQTYWGKKLPLHLFSYLATENLRELVL